MSTVVLSPHTDDAIFSIGAHLTTLNDVVIASVFAGIPEDDTGRKKHTTLRAEHAKACELLGAEPVNGDFLDDVYPASPRYQIQTWISGTTSAYRADTVFIPFGIHHPDHVLISNLTINLINASGRLPSRTYFYEELPYRVDYPELSAIRFNYLENTVGRLRMLEAFTDDTVKREAVTQYQSQISADLINRVMVRERIWELIR